mmetsp:Transcript_96512/g.288066  ORF Transcript_96512/g.288066 Transcript_96512/m.288066 type:complete len:235 (-) Transcript_96512:107-811(-)
MDDNAVVFDRSPWPGGSPCGKNSRVQRPHHAPYSATNAAVTQNQRSAVRERKLGQRIRITICWYTSRAPVALAEAAVRQQDLLCSRQAQSYGHLRCGDGVVVDVVHSQASCLPASLNEKLPRRRRQTRKRDDERPQVRPGSQQVILRWKPSHQNLRISRWVCAKREVDLWPRKPRQVGMISGRQPVPASKLAGPIRAPHLNVHAQSRCWGLRRELQGSESWVAPAEKRCSRRQR